MSLPLPAEALVQLARKRRMLDRAQAARLTILLQHQEVDSVAKVRAFLGRSGNLPALVAKKLLEHIPQPDQVPFGPHQALAHLADGGMGSVWLAAGAPGTAQDGRLVVIKTMRGNLAGNAEVKHRFDREVRYMMELQHESVVRAIGSGAADDGTLFMVLDFVEHGDLKDLVETGGALPEALALAMIYQVADALTLAHQKQLIHRDIKPANIFASPDGKAKLADFGIARSTANERTQLTMQGALVGSPYYMSPEQVIADPNLDIRSDLYALGAVLYYCLAGTDPYRGKLQEVLHAHRTAPIPDVRQVNKGVSEATQRIIATCMAKTREGRYKDPAALRDAILAALGSTAGPIAGMPPARPAVEDRTIAVDLAAEAAAHGAGDQPSSRYASAGSDSRATVMADLAPKAPAGDLGMTINVGTDEWNGGAAATTPMGARPLDGPRVDGDFPTALEHTWLALTGDGLSLGLFARRMLVMGKLCEPPVDVCLRKYPTAQFRDDCLKISRQHLRLQYDPGSSRLLIGDLGASNGTWLDGTQMQPSSAQPLPEGDHTLNLANALKINVRARAKRSSKLRELTGAPESTGQFACGIDHDHAFDCCVFARPDNRPGMAYAMVLRRIVIGGANADLQLPGAQGPDLELAVYNGRWLHRATGGTHAGELPWRPLAAGSTVTAGGRQLRAAVGSHELYQAE